MDTERQLAAGPTPSLRLVTKVARLFHVRGLGQSEIAERMRLPPPRVAQLLAQAEELGIVALRADVRPRPRAEDAHLGDVGCGLRWSRCR